MPRADARSRSTAEYNKVWPGLCAGMCRRRLSLAKLRAFLSPSRPAQPSASSESPSMTQEAAASCRSRWPSPQALLRLDRRAQARQQPVEIADQFAQLGIEGGFRRRLAHFS